MTDLIAVVETTARDPLTGAFALTAVGGLKNEMLEDRDAELQDLVLTVHHCFMLSLMNTHAHKIIENHLGRAMVKQTAPQFMLQMPPGLSPAPARGSPT